MRFRWVELQIDVILNVHYPIRHWQDVRVKLKKLHEDTAHLTLNSVYDDMFVINVQDQQYLRSLFVKAMKWTLCSFKPLTLEDFIRSIALDSSGTIDKAVDQDFVLQICSNFVVMTKSGHMKFAHRSVKEYLLAGRLPGRPNGELNMISAHIQAAETYLSFLLTFEDTSKWHALPIDLDEAAGDLDFSGFEIYACFYWASHCEQARIGLSLADLRKLYVWFVHPTRRHRTTRAFAKWNSLIWRVFNSSHNAEGIMRQRLEGAVSARSSPFFTACVWGFTETVEAWLRIDASLLDTKNRQGKCGLFLACEHGQSGVVELLLKEGAPLDLDDVWVTSLQAPAWGGNGGIFKTLLRHEMSPGTTLAEVFLNAPPGYYGRTLNAALQGRNAEIVAAALEAGVDVWADMQSKIPPLGNGHWVYPPEKRSIETCLFNPLINYRSLAQSTSSLRVMHQSETLLLQEIFPKGRVDILVRLQCANIVRRRLFETVGRFHATERNPFFGATQNLNHISSSEGGPLDAVMEERKFTDSSGKLSLSISTVGVIVAPINPTTLILIIVCRPGANRNWTTWGRKICVGIHHHRKYLPSGMNSGATSATDFWEKN